MKIIKIESLGHEDVYNMAVENHHNFAVNGGFLVHNCDAIRYFIAGRPCTSNAGTITPGKSPRRRYDFNTEAGRDEDDDEDTRGRGFYG